MVRTLVVKILKAALFAVRLTLVLAIVWALSSVVFVRFIVDSDSSEPEQTGLDSKALFEIATQANRISFDTDHVSAQAALAWVKGTPLFFTNEHVAKHMCDKQNVCRFKEKDALDLFSRAKELRKGVCLPQRDICVLYATEDKKSAEDFNFAATAVGQDVYYVDWEAPEYRIIKGTIVDKKGSDLIIKGYGRHGFSGSPVFNQQGQVAGIISQPERSWWLLAPHYFMFGWVQSDTFRVVTEPSSFWMNQSQLQLARSEWAKALKELTIELPSTPEACTSSWTSAKVVFQFLWLTENWRNDFKDPRYFNVIDRFSEDEDIDFHEMCAAFLKLSQSP